MQQLNIAIGNSVLSKKWVNKQIDWRDFTTRIKNPVITHETLNEYLHFSKAEQNHIKDVGGYVGGLLADNSRSKTSVLSRSMITLDIDFANSNTWWDFTTLYNCAAIIHATHKSNESNLRLRLIIPLERDVSPEEYQAVSRKIAQSIGLSQFDRTTFDINRLMFWPSIPSDVKYYCYEQTGNFLDPDTILSTYEDWKDFESWPKFEDEQQTVVIGKNQEDPRDKKNIVGLFCRTFSIEDAIEKFLSDKYISCGDNRYTYTGGTTSGGAITYENLFLYSHHSSDPASGRLCNAFDLVRIHKFGYLDRGQHKDETKSQSYKAMEQFVTSIDEIKLQIASEKFNTLKEEFGSFTKQPSEVIEENTDWLKDLQIDKSGKFVSSANNINIIFENDTNIKLLFRLNTFCNKIYIMYSPPWRIIDGDEPMRDIDFSGIRNYFECVYGISSNSKIEDSLVLTAEKHNYHPVRDYLSSLTWDGKNRIDHLLHEYFGAEDSEYTSAAMRKSLCAAVARIFNPGIKFDNLLVLVGAQGTYKSTFFKRLGREWFSDTFLSVQGKEAFEQLNGVWIMEIAELAGLKKAEVESVKHFISKSEDTYRPAYGRVVETYKRQCIFFGSTNQVEFLRDETGNRRFVPIQVCFEDRTKSVIDDLTKAEVDQIWAEAVSLYLNGESLFFSAFETKSAEASQLVHMEIDNRAGVVDEYLNVLLPKNWDNVGLDARRDFFLSSKPVEKGNVRTEVCAMEIWCECFNKERADFSQKSSREISKIMSALVDWEYVQASKRFPIYGKQRYFKRKML